MAFGEARLSHLSPLAQLQVELGSKPAKVATLVSVTHDAVRS